MSQFAVRGNGALGIQHSRWSTTSNGAQIGPKNETTKRGLRKSMEEFLSQVENIRIVPLGSEKIPDLMEAFQVTETTHTRS